MAHKTDSGWRGWAKEKKIAAKFCEREGLELIESTAEYQTAKIKGEGVCIVIYPHKTTAGNRHLRLRDEHSKDRDRALDIMDELDELSGLNCTFSTKGK